MQARSFLVEKNVKSQYLYIVSGSVVWYTSYEVPGSVVCGINARFVSPGAKCKAIFELVQVH